MANNAELPLELTRLAHFVHVVDDGGFTGAARSLGTTKSTVSRSVTDLEARLGVKLLARTTRKLSLTDPGRRLYERCAPMLQGMNAAMREAAGSRAVPRGTLRVFAPTALGRFFLSGLLPEFLRRFEEVTLDLTYAERSIDVVSEGFDVAFLAGPAAPAGLLVKRYGPVPRLLCATTSYLARHEELRTPDDLQRHACLAWCERPGAPVVWQLSGSEGTARVKITPRVRANSSEELMALMMGGVGIGSPPALTLDTGLASKHLRRVLPAWSLEPLTFSILSPPERRADPKVSCFLAHVTESLDQRATW
ncbi:MAG: LysR family transcriptional regulator [Byssovorax sp.]